MQEARLSAELGRWRVEADRADSLTGRIATAEAERDVADKRLRDLKDLSIVILGGLGQLSLRAGSLPYKRSSTIG